MRQPVYTTNGAWRIVSVPSDLWRLQERMRALGTPTKDPWDNRSPAVSYGRAWELLQTKQPPKQKVGVA